MTYKEQNTLTLKSAELRKSAIEVVTRAMQLVDSDTVSDIVAYVNDKTRLYTYKIDKPQPPPTPSPKQKPLFRVIKGDSARTD